MNDAEEKSPEKKSLIVLQLQRNTQSLVDLKESVSILETRLNVVLLSPPPQKESEGEQDSKEESKVLRSLRVQNGNICNINTHIRELIGRLEA